MRTSESADDRVTPPAMIRPVWEFPIALPRHAFSPRDAARAGDLWRCFQEAAVEASTLAGWSPVRYRGVGTAFLVRSVTVRHHREATYGEETRARTWVSNFRRGIFSARQVRLLAGSDPISSATQEWVHISSELKPQRAPEELVECFPIHEEGESVALPEWTEEEGAEHEFQFRCWHTWMDPLAHVNHPAYVDWCDESISRVMASAGLSPVALRPVAERMTFKSGATAEDEICVRTRRIGRVGDEAVVFAHRVLRADGGVCAEGTTVRALAGGAATSLAEAWG